MPTAGNSGQTPPSRHGQAHNQPLRGLRGHSARTPCGRLSRTGRCYQPEWMDDEGDQCAMHGPSPFAQWCRCARCWLRRRCRPHRCQGMSGYGGRDGRVFENDHGSGSRRPVSVLQLPVARGRLGRPRRLEKRLGGSLPQLRRRNLVATRETGSGRDRWVSTGPFRSGLAQGEWRQQPASCATLASKQSWSSIALVTLVVGILFTVTTIPACHLGYRGLHRLPTWRGVVTVTANVCPGTGRRSCRCTVMATRQCPDVSGQRRLARERCSGPW